MPSRGDKYAVVYVDGDVPQLPIQLGQLLVDTTLVSPGTPVLLQCTDVNPVTYEAIAGGGGAGTVTNVATGAGLTGGPITTTGTVALNAASIASLALADTALQAADLTGYVQDTRQVIAGAGLTGGGTLAADRTFDVGAGTGIAVNANDVALSAGSIASLALADSATQPGDNVSTLVNDSGYLTAATLSNSVISRLNLASNGGFTDIGISLSSSGTASTPAYAATNIYTRCMRRRFTSNTGTNVTARVSTSTGTGGYIGARNELVMVFAVHTAASTQRAFFGWAQGTLAPSGSVEPSAAINCIFLAKDNADADLQIMHNDGSGTCTKIPITGVTLVSLVDHLLRLTVTTPGGDVNSFTYELYDLNTSSIVASGTISSNCPANSLFLDPNMWVSTATGTGAIDLEFVFVKSTSYPGTS